MTKEKPTPVQRLMQNKLIDETLIMLGPEDEELLVSSSAYLYSYSMSRFLDKYFETRTKHKWMDERKGWFHGFY